MAAAISRARHAALGVAVVLVNFLLFGFGFLLWERLLYGRAPEAAFMAACFLAMGALLRLWSFKWWMVIVPSAAGYLWGLGALKWAIHLTDTRGEYAPPMAQYVFSPSLWEVLEALVATVAAWLGWWVMRRLLTAGRKARAGTMTTLLVLGVASVPGCASVGLQSRDYVFGVTGAVTAEEGGAPLQDAEVTLEVSGPVYAAVEPVKTERRLTDSTGGFVFTYISHARGVRYTVTVSKEGFEPQAVSGSAPPAGHHTIRLKEQRGTERPKR